MICFLNTAIQQEGYGNIHFVPCTMYDSLFLVVSTPKAERKREQGTQGLNFLSPTFFLFVSFFSAAFQPTSHLRLYYHYSNNGFKSIHLQDSTLSFTRG